VNRKILRAAVLAAVLLAAGPGRAERVKDIVDIQGIRSNPLWGYGLVVGLNATGDNSKASQRALANTLRRTGLILTPDDVTSKNVASVLVVAELPPFARNGSTIDVTISTVGNCTSLQGGTLLMTPLMGADGQVYAVAQGPVSVGGAFSVSGQSATVSKNHTTVGMIPNGANVEKEELSTYIKNGQIALQLRNADFGTAQRITEGINAEFPRAACTVDPANIRVEIPKGVAPAQVPGFIDKICSLNVKVDYAAVVVINERTGTVVVGENVGISTVAISHGNLSIVTQEKDTVSQPNAFSNGKTTKEHSTDIQATEEGGAMHVVQRQVSVSELARALNAMGLTPRDIVAIFEALRQAGALQAQLKIM
jgi:flagellar P-ring protein precursor FlgI